MRIPLEWLKEYVTIRLNPEALAERLTMAGLEVTGIERATGEAVLELEITPNRADCLSILGVAREVAAITGQRLTLPVAGQGTRDKGQASQKRTRPPSPDHRPIIRIEDRNGCSRYIGRLIEGVKIGPSPEWMQQRLAACGIRAINNVVDITNYVLLEYGQPLHAFDFSRLAEGTILVRRATTGEPITTLDGVARKLTTDTLVIADVKRPVAVAGVMGGMGSEVTGTTKTVLLESALFDPLTVRRTARKLGLTSESSYRFERGVDPLGVETASVRAAHLIEQLAGGTTRLVRDVGTKPSKRTILVLEGSRANRWLGTSLTSSTMRSYLVRLSCRVASSGAGDVQRVEVPSFRRDLAQPVDLYEELARTVGYDKLPSTLPSAVVVATPPSERSAFRHAQSLRCLCAAAGLVETVTWSLVSEQDLLRCGMRLTEAVRVANPLSQDHAHLRPSLVAGLLASVRRNLTQGAHGVRFFEVGRVFVRRPDGSVDEQLRVGMALAGTWSRDWQGKLSSDFFRLKGVLETVVHALCRGTIQLEAGSVPWAQAGHAARALLDGQPLGVTGQVAKDLLQAMDVEQPVWIGELQVDALLRAARTDGAVVAPVMLPPVKRDLSVVVGNDVTFEAVEQVIRDVGRPLAYRVELIDRYTGKQVPASKYSVTFSIEYRDPSRTLTDDEVEARHQAIGQALTQRFAAQLR